MNCKRIGHLTGVLSFISCKYAMSMTLTPRANASKFQEQIKGIHYPTQL